VSSQDPEDYTGDSVLVEFSLQKVRVKEAPPEVGDLSGGFFTTRKTIAKIPIERNNT